MTSESKFDIVLIGSDPHIIRSCIGRGLNLTIVRDVSAHLRGGDPLPKSFQEVVVADVADVGEVCAALTRLAGGDMPDCPRGIVTSNEFAVCTVAALADLFGCPGPTMACTVRMRDKYLQKQHIRNAGLPTAESRVVVAGSDSQRAPFPGPCVVKPLAGSASADTEKVLSESAYRSAMKRLATSATSPLVVEQLIDAREEWVVDGVVQAGVLAFSSVGRYGKPVIDYTTVDDLEDLYTGLRVYRMDATGADERCDEARALACKALEALCYRDGVFHMELLLERSSGTLYFSECAGRRGGGMIQEEVAVKHGFSLADAAVDVALGEPVATARTPTSRHVGTTYLHLPRGTIVKLPNPAAFTTSGYLHDIYISALLGVNDPPTVRSTSYHQAMCVVSGDSAENLEENMRRAQTNFVEQSLVAPTFATKAEQRAFMARYEDSWKLLL